MKSCRPPVKESAFRYLWSGFDLLYRHGLETLCLKLLQRMSIDSVFTGLLLRFYAFTKGLQMSPEEIRAIIPWVRNAGSLLIFGLGRDTSMWIALGPEDIVFLEDDPRWVCMNSGFREHIREVGYRTQRRDYVGLLQQPDKLAMDLPGEILHRCWDVVLVDAPNGYEDHHPGRMQSIFMASRLASPGGFVIIHDMDRTVEQVYARKFLGACIHTCQRLGIFDSAGNGREDDHGR